MQKITISLLPLILICSGLASSPQPQNVTVTKFQIEISSSEVVAATLIMEAGGEGVMGMEAVREVIANRAKGKEEITVCLAPKQFSCWSGIPISKGIEIAKKHPNWTLALFIARSKPTNHTKGATHYHNLKVSPSWAKKLKKTASIKNHIFYR
jgi:spore germination cell wall hydrolase CwlJ-like protein